MLNTQRDASTGAPVKWLGRRAVQCTHSANTECLCRNRMREQHGQHKEIGLTFVR